jgi:hypothetical protein
MKAIAFTVTTGLFANSSPRNAENVRGRGEAFDHYIQQHFFHIHEKKRLVAERGA